MVPCSICSEGAYVGHSGYGARTIRSQMNVKEAAHARNDD